MKLCDIYKTINVTSRHEGPKCKCSWSPLGSWYCALSPHYACIRRSDIILTPKFVPNFISFATSIAEL